MNARRRNAQVGLPGHERREFRTLGDAVGPAPHDALVARVKAHSFLAEIFHATRNEDLRDLTALPAGRYRAIRSNAVLLSVSTGNGMAAKKMNAESSTRLRELR